MSEKENVRKYWLNIRLNKEEFAIIDKYFRSSTSRQMSGYARNILLGKPVIVRYRNATADDILAELILLRKELNHIGNNFNQAVKKLHLTKDISGIRDWIIVHENLHFQFIQKTEEINQKIIELSRKW